MKPYHQFFTPSPASSALPAALLICISSAFGQTTGDAPTRTVGPVPGTVAESPALERTLRSTTLRDHFDHVHFDAPGDGALWARGRSYKARFDAHGATYIPIFGSAAPRNFPVSFAV